MIKNGNGRAEIFHVVMETSDTKYNTVGRILIAWCNDWVLDKSGQIMNPIIVMVDPIPYYSIYAHLSL